MLEYPKILVINDQSIYKNNATGITLRSLFKSWPDECLLEFCLDSDCIEKKDKNFSECIIESFPVQKIMRNVASNDNKKINISVKINSTGNVSIKKKLKNRSRRLLINVADLSFMKISKSIYKTLKEYSPDIIYTLGASVSVMRMSVHLSEYLGIPIVLHFMDDWPHFLQDEYGLGQQYYKKQLQKWLKKCYQHSKISIAISPQMAATYEKETGIPHVALMNSVDVKSLFCKDIDVNEEIRFVYTGGLHLNRWQALLDIENAIKQASEKSKLKGRLIIYTKLQDTFDIQDYFDSTITQFHDYVKHNEIKTVYENAHVLVHAETNNPILVGFFRFSISTKIPEYLATNRPVLFYGPKEMGLSEYLLKNDCSFVANDKKQLMDNIYSFFCNYDKMKSVCTRARDLVINQHEIGKSQELLFNTIKYACKNK